GDAGAGGAGGGGPDDGGCGCRTAPGADEGHAGSLLVVLGALGLVIGRRRKAA
ncbi:MYXO-CTERM sorting domain-containing protein, partial [Polyangium sorediatum]|uniref:MYXO-CTERM sorting domain-containing protein n=1 Tax=Polyangium sorediatum TaxID=889274 RepID=UPI003CCC260D